MKSLLSSLTSSADATARARGRRAPSRSASGGFTLIELLTVIAIIGILAAILVPVVGRVRESARKVESMNRLRAIYTGFALYAQDNKNALPVVYSTTKDASGRTYGTWMNQLARDGYMGNPNGMQVANLEIFGCPLQLAQHPELTATKATYSMNEYLGNHPDKARSPHGARYLHQFSEASQTGLVFSGRWSGTGFSSSTLDPASYVSTLTEQPPFSGGVFVLFADGHVVAKKLDTIPEEMASAQGKLFWLGKY